MSRPYSRKCNDCGRGFTSRSNGRIYCYVCSPPQHMGRGRRDGRVSGTGLPSAHGHAAQSRASEVEDFEHTTEIDDAIAEVVRDEHAAGIKRNRWEDRVRKLGRPSGGWGKCKHIDPETGKHALCAMERWSDTVPFCLYHLKFWRERKLEARAKKVAEEDKGDKKAAKFSLGSFKVKTPQDALDLLSKVSYAVYMGVLPFNKAKVIRELVTAQIRALDSKILSKKIEAILASKYPQKDPLAIPEDDDGLEHDIQTAQSLGISTDEVEGDGSVAPKTQAG